MGRLDTYLPKNSREDARGKVEKGGEEEAAEARRRECGCAEETYECDRTCVCVCVCV